MLSHALVAIVAALSLLTLSLYGSTLIHVVRSHRALPVVAVSFHAWLTHPSSGPTKSSTVSRTLSAVDEPSIRDVWFRLSLIVVQTFGSAVTNWKINSAFVPPVANFLSRRASFDCRSASWVGRGVTTNHVRLLASILISGIFLTRSLLFFSPRTGAAVQYKTGEHRLARNTQLLITMQRNAYKNKLLS